MTCVDSCEPVPPKLFGTDLVAGTEGRLSLVRYVSLNMVINGFECREFIAKHSGGFIREIGECATTNFMQCWSKVAKWYGPEALPALEHLCLDFTQAVIEKQHLLNVRFPVLKLI